MNLKKKIRQDTSHRRKPLRSTRTQPSAKGQGTQTSSKIIRAATVARVEEGRLAQCYKPEEDDLSYFSFYNIFRLILKHYELCGCVSL